MKRYIKPNTKVHQMELMQMIAASGDTQQVDNKGNLGGDTGGFTFGGKKNDFSLWGDSNEEE